jgi:hypothetical protein
LVRNVNRLITFDREWAARAVRASKLASGQSLLIFTATPGTESHEKLALLTVLGTDQFAVGTE